MTAIGPRPPRASAERDLGRPGPMPPPALEPGTGGTSAAGLGDLRPPPAASTAHPERDTLPNGGTTRFAPAPTGDLHLGHLVNVVYTWGIARATGGRVILRIEDHDRQRSRPEHEVTLLRDLERLGLSADEPPPGTFDGPTPYRQSDAGQLYESAVGQLHEAGLVYACDCSRATFSAWEARHGRPWRGVGCPGGCRARDIPRDGGVGLRVAVGAGSERWVDLLAGPMIDEPAATGDLLVRDRVGNWTYTLCVVVDDLRQGIDLVIRGRDLLHATAVQIRLGRLLGRERPASFLHHPLVRHQSGRKLSKASDDTSIRSMLDAGRTPRELLGIAAWLAGLRESAAPVEPTALADLFA